MTFDNAFKEAFDFFPEPHQLEYFAELLREVPLQKTTEVFLATHFLDSRIESLHSQIVDMEERLKDLTEKGHPDSIETSFLGDRFY